MLKLHNSYTKRKEIFRPLKDKVVKMYNCGPTVYDFVHIGNLRSFLFSDILRRYLEYRGYRVKQIMNITDVGHMVSDADAGEDKMAVAAKREGKGPLEIARFYEEKFFEDVKALNITPALKYPRATDHIPEMIEIIKKLLARKHAYFVPEHGGGNSVYYDLSTFPKYGKLSGNKVEDLIPGARAEVVHEKRNPYDFALWIYKPNHALQWETPWGRGYPGWHLECSAMSKKYLGDTLDIHTGGEDNKFPHHECEIAQSEGATGKQFVRYWMHVKHLLVDGKKMSKSLSNFYTLRDLLQKGFSARAIRYVLISTHYREALNFTLESIKAAENTLARLDEVAVRLGKKNLPKESTAGTITKVRRAFAGAMDDDLNVAKALGVLFDFVRTINKNSDYSRGASVFIKEVDAVLGLGMGVSKVMAVPDEVMKLLEKRENARKVKKWAEADILRKEIEQLGYIIEDTADGSQVKPKR